MYNNNICLAKVVKHPLQNAWTLWFFKNEKGRSWEQNQRQIITGTCLLVMFIVLVLYFLV